MSTETMIGDGGGGCIRTVIAIGAALSLAACNTTSGTRPEPIVVTKEVVKPVPVKCVPDNLGPPPSYPDTDEALKSATPDRRYQLVIAGRDLRGARLGEVEPVIEGCRQ